MGHDFLHPQSPEFQRGMKTKDVSDKLNVKNKFLLYLIDKVLPLTQKFVTRQLTKVAAYATISLATLAAGYGIENEDTNSQIAAVGAGIIGAGLFALDLGVAWLKEKINPPPKAELVIEDAKEQK